jgi:hypothetical protein
MAQTSSPPRAATTWPAPPPARPRGTHPRTRSAATPGARFSSDAAYASGMYWQVINGTGAAVSPTNDGPSDVVSAS